MTVWTQKGFALLSDIPENDMPFLHDFLMSRHDADAALRRAAILPDRLKLNLRVAEAEVRFDDTKSQTD